MFIAGAGYLAPAIAADKVIVGAAFLCAAIFAAFAIRRTVNRSTWACVAGSIAFVCSPVLFNKLGAGHVGFWYAYALLPIIYERSVAVARGNRAAVPSLAIVTALSSLQPQFVVFDFFVAFSVAVSERTVRAWMGPVTVFFAALFGNSATIFAILSSGKSLIYHVPTPVGYWDIAQSTPLPWALNLAHYLAPYYEQVPYSTVGAWAITLGALLGWALRFRSRVTGASLSLAVIGLLVLTGTLGPAGPIWTWMFQHVWASTAMREFYNGGAMVSLAYALAIAQGVGALHPRAAIAVPTALIAACFPLLGGGVGRVMPNAVPPRYWQRDLQALKRVPPGKVLALPSLVPLLNDGLPVGGMDAFAIRDATHGSTTEYPMLFPLTAITFGGDVGRTWWRRVLKVADVTSIQSRPNMMAAEPTARHSWGGISRPPYGLFELNPSRQAFFFARAFPMTLSYKDLPTDGIGLSTAVGPLPGKGGSVHIVIPNPSRIYDDRDRAWVDYGRWRFRAPHPEDAVADGVLTASNVPLVVVASALDRPSVLLSAHGTVRLRCRSGWQQTITLNSTEWYALGEKCGILTVRVRNGTAVVERVAEGTAVVPRGHFKQPHIIEETRPWPWEIDIRLSRSQPAPTMLVFGERYSDNWKVEGAQVLWHGVADGFANAWEIESVSTRLRLVYTPQRLFNALSAVAVFGYVGCLIAFVTMRRSRWNGLRG